MSNLTDRTGDIRIVSAPKEFEASEMWKESFQQLEIFIENLGRMKYIAIEDYVNINVKLRWRKMLKKLADDDTVSLLKLGGLQDDRVESLTLIRALSLSQLTKYFLTFSRKVSYDWYYDKCVKGINDYTQMRERLIGYEEHLGLPELKLPHYDESKVLPFVKEAVEAFTQWRNTIYDPTTAVVKLLPMRAMVNTSYGGNKSILNIDQSTDGEVTEEDLAMLDVYDTEEIIEKLKEIEKKYDIESAWHVSQVALHALLKLREPLGLE